MNTFLDNPAISTLVGTPKEVQARLGKSGTGQVLALTFDHLPPRTFEALAANITNVASSMLEVLLQQRDPESLERLVDVLMPRTPPSPRLLREAAALVQARTAVLESGDWLTAAEVAQLAGLSTRNTSAQPNKWKKQGQIFAIHHNGTDYFPAYGLDRDAGFRPSKALADVIGILQGHKDSWGMAYWFRSPNGFLGNKCPKDLFGTRPERVVAAAHDEVQEIGHG
jgi:hypothetical protein